MPFKQMFTWPFMPSWNSRITRMNFSVQPICFKTFHNPFRLTVSNALVRSMKIMYKSCCCSRHFSWICLAVKIISAVPRPGRNPHWLSGMMFCPKTCDDNRFMMMRPSISPAMDKSDIPWWLSQETLSPFRLYMWTMRASLKSWGTSPASHMLL